MIVQYSYIKQCLKINIFYELVLRFATKYLVLLHYFSNQNYIM